MTYIDCLFCHFSYCDAVLTKWCPGIVFFLNWINYVIWHNSRIQRYLVGVWLTPRNIPFWAGKHAQLVKKFPTFNGTPRFIAVLTATRPPVPILGHMNPIQLPETVFPYHQFNIILASSLPLKSDLLPLSFPTHILYEFSSPPCGLRAPPISSSLIRKIQEYFVKCLNCGTPHYADFSIFLLRSKYSPQHSRLKTPSFNVRS